MSNDETNWTEFREFAAVDLEQSFVVAWEKEGESLMIDVDVVLRPEHKFYEEPRPAEGACFRQAAIEFPFCTQIAEQGKDGSDQVAEAIESFSAGRIAGFRRTGIGRYAISGEFGTVEITADRPLLRLKAPLNGIPGIRPHGNQE
jgi:hypothetical protein